MIKDYPRTNYPKLVLLVLSFFVAYAMFRERNLLLLQFLPSVTYFGTFLAGIFYAYGFTAAPATALLLVLAKSQNLLLAGLIGGFGALLSDLVIFFLIRLTVSDELNELSKQKMIQVLGNEEKRLLGRFHKYLLAVFAGFIIASPLPTEIGVALMASIRRLPVKRFALLAYLLHTAGIFVILTTGIVARF